MLKLSDRLFYILLGIGAIAVLALLCFFDPSTPCPTNALTKIHCPGCGTLRAMHALLHGDVKEALSQNILAVIFIPILPAIYFFPKYFKKPIVPAAMLVIFILYAILRNLLRIKRENPRPKWHRQNFYFAPNLKNFL